MVVYCSFSILNTVLALFVAHSHVTLAHGSEISATLADSTAVTTRVVMSVAGASEGTSTRNSRVLARPSDSAWLAHGLESVFALGLRADDVGHVATPERAHALLLRNAGEGVRDTIVAGNLAGSNLGVRILGLDDELHTLCTQARRTRDMSDTPHDTPHKKRSPRECPVSAKCGPAAGPRALVGHATYLYNPTRPAMHSAWPARRPERRLS